MPSQPFPVKIILHTSNYEFLIYEIFLLQCIKFVNYNREFCALAGKYFTTLLYLYEGWSATQKRQIGPSGDKHCTCHPKNLNKQRL